MATTIHGAEEIVLLDGSKITLRPLKISLLRKFLTKFEGVAAVADDNDKSISVLMECVALAMQQYKPDFSGSVEELEELVDLPTVYKIVEIATGVNLADIPEVSL